MGARFYSKLNESKWSPRGTDHLYVRGQVHLDIPVRAALANYILLMQHSNGEDCFVEKSSSNGADNRWRDEAIGEIGEPKSKDVINRCITKTTRNGGLSEHFVGESQLRFACTSML